MVLCVTEGKKLTIAPSPFRRQQLYEALKDTSTFPLCITVFPRWAEVEDDITFFVSKYTSVSFLFLVLPPPHSCIPPLFSSLPPFLPLSSLSLLPLSQARLSSVHRTTLRSQSRHLCLTLPLLPRWGHLDGPPQIHVSELGRQTYEPMFITKYNNAALFLLEPSLATSVREEEKRSPSMCQVHFIF